MRKLALLVAIVAVLLVGGSASAQNIVNPNAFEFTCSTDQGPATKYQIGIFRSTVQATTIAVDPPTPVAGVCTVTVDLSSLALYTNYHAKVRLYIDATHASPWSEAGPLFDRAPELAAPGPPTPIRQ